jgi:hypothetical protein
MKVRWSFVAAMITFFLMPFLAVQACGPDFSEDLFVLKLNPDDPKEFAKGKLGILRPTFQRADLIVAFRYSTEAG